MKNKNTLSLIVIFLIIGIFSAMSMTKADTDVSLAERRPLAQKPEFSPNSVFGGQYMTDFESYKVDQLPFRDKLRTLKANFSTKILGKKDNNGLFFADGHLSKIEYPQNDDMLKIAKEKFDYLYESYMKDTDVSLYLCLVPDKNLYFAKENGYLSLDYEKFKNDFSSSLDNMEYIDIFDMLSSDDYYRTDSHWKQENIIDIAQYIASSMGADAKTEYDINTLHHPFEGVYLGQSALDVKPDTIKYLTNDELNECIVTYYDTGMPVVGEMYNMEKATSKDPYEMFLSGASPLVTIENPSFEGDRELVVFRDSFASSLAPLLSKAYSKITLVDIRYIQSSFVGNFVSFDNQDVLFLYSTSLINNSSALN